MDATARARSPRAVNVWTRGITRVPRWGVPFVGNLSECYYRFRVIPARPRSAYVDVVECGSLASSVGDEGGAGAPRLATPVRMASFTRPAALVMPWRSIRR